LKARKKASESAIDLTRYEQKPSFGVGLDYAMITGRSAVDLEGNGRDVIMPMGQITIPLNKSRYSAKQREEKIAQEAIDLKIQDAIQDFNAEKETAQANLKVAESKISKYESLKNITRETLNLMRSEFASEGTRFEELIRMEMELIEYDAAILVAKYLKNIAYSTLEKYR
jgi:outer membrane protein TolC